MFDDRVEIPGDPNYSGVLDERTKDVSASEDAPTEETKCRETARVHFHQRRIPHPVGLSNF